MANFWSHDLSNTYLIGAMLAGEKTMRGRFKVFVVGMVMGGVVGAQPMVPPGFAFLDRNHDGYLSPEELSRASGHLTPEVARFLDFNGDGAISPDEWRQGRQQVRSDMVKGAVRLGTQHLLGVQPPPTFLLGRYLELRQRYEATHRAAADPALQQGYDQPQEPYTQEDAYDNQPQAVRRDAQSRYDDSQERHDDRPRSAGSAAQEHDDAAQEGDDEQRDVQLDNRQVNRRQPTQGQGRHDENQGRYDEQSQAARRHVQEKYDNSPERYDAAQEGDVEPDDRHANQGHANQDRQGETQERYGNQRPTPQGAARERLGDLRSRYENRHGAMQRAVQERFDEMHKAGDGQAREQSGRSGLHHRRSSQARDRAQGRQHASFPILGQGQPSSGHGGLMRHPGLGHHARRP
jgi:hypothetical protein